MEKNILDEGLNKCKKLDEEYDTNLISVPLPVTREGNEITAIYGVGEYTLVIPEGITAVGGIRWQATDAKSYGYTIVSCTKVILPSTLEKIVAPLFSLRAQSDGYNITVVFKGDVMKLVNYCLSDDFKTHDYYGRQYYKEAAEKLIMAKGTKNREKLLKIFLCRLLGTAQSRTTLEFEVPFDWSQLEPAEITLGSDD